MSATYKVGDFLVIDNDCAKNQFEILSVSPKLIKLRDSLSGVQSERKVRELDELVVSGVAIIHPKNTRERELLDTNVIDFASYPEELKQKARERYVFVSEILGQNLKSLSAKRLSPIVEKIYQENSFKEISKKPSVRAVRYWLDNYQQSNCSIRALLPRNHAKGNRDAKLESIYEPYIEKAIEYFKAPEQPSVAKAYDHLATLIHFDNRVIPISKKMKVPTLTAFIKRLEKYAKKEIIAARLGKAEANKLFKLNQLSQDITFILQRVEVDHTSIDLFIVDSKLSMVLGRPYITVLLDYKSDSILGFYIGFEKPSYLSIARVLRHSILPKGYIKERYPEVQNAWECYGIPKVLAVDRGKDFESIALIDACHDLNIRIERNPGKHPWYKGSVESFFKSLNEKLLQDMKGKVFPNIVDTNLYNPEKNAIITMDLFLYIFHIWIVDLYQPDFTSKRTIIPRESWIEDLDSVPRRIMNENSLDIVLSEVSSRMNSSNGIVLNHIWYDSDELVKLRSEIGFTNVQLKFNREDLGYIYVLDERDPLDKRYFKVPAKDQKYANGLSLHQHQVIKTFNKNKLNNKYDPEALACAKMKIIELISDYLNSTSSKKTFSNQKISRFFDIGQQKDQSVRSSVVDIPTTFCSEPQSISDCNESQHNSEAEIPTEELEIYDGKDNTLPDKLDF
ncbi:DDE-type integrase/transposase/recombinase [Shewanella sp. 202IG2-18]|uniref:Mu transposase C-terminal domain-containing protein n=1 Tax=Parashewanella hymeniacidonis TaxID=2807618 RepID=UPI001960B5B6|nr:Mu transposase C-terminal domain-containing protein [Parashewanella hymeniacidonis]MBM7070680.1 DDE-type integrase/transposase/recombinase [Parashewanella hymeniacidonis]